MANQSIQPGTTQQKSATASVASGFLEALASRGNAVSGAFAQLLDSVKMTTTVKNGTAKSTAAIPADMHAQPVPTIKRSTHDGTTPTSTKDGAKAPKHHVDDDGAKQGSKQASATPAKSGSNAAKTDDAKAGKEKPATSQNADDSSKAEGVSNTEDAQASLPPTTATTTPVTAQTDQKFAAIPQQPVVDPAEAFEPQDDAHEQAPEDKNLADDDGAEQVQAVTQDSREGKDAKLSVNAAAKPSAKPVDELRTAPVANPKALVDTATGDTAGNETKADVADILLKQALPKATKAVEPNRASAEIYTNKAATPVHLNLSSDQQAVTDADITNNGKADNLSSPQDKLLSSGAGNLNPPTGQAAHDKAEPQIATNIVNLTPASGQMGNDATSQQGKGTGQMPLEKPQAPILLDAVKSGNAYGFASQLSASKASTQNTPTRQPTPVEQVVVQISKGIKIGQSQVVVQLQPAELGRVQVQLDFAKNGQVTGTVTADNQATLDLLSKDAKALTQALKDAGLDVGQNSLQFNLGQSSRHASQQETGNGGKNGNPGTRNSAGNAETVIADDTETYYITPERINVRV